MIQTIKKAWAIPELRKKIVFTALILLIFRIGNAIPVPYVDTKLLGDYLSQMSTTVLGLYDVMSGGAFASATVFALGVQPYINSSIIIQLLTIAIPPLERLAREGGEEGKKEALKWFKKAVKFKPDAVDTNYFLALYDVDAGDYAAAREKLEICLEGRISPLNYATNERVKELLATLPQ